MLIQNIKLIYSFKVIKSHLINISLSTKSYLEIFSKSRLLFSKPRLLFSKTKIAILKNREQSEPPTLNQVLAMLKSQFRIEKCNAERSGNLRFLSFFLAPIWRKIQIL